MASDARLSLPCRLPARLPPPPALRRFPPRAAAAVAAASTSPRCRVLTTAVPARPRGRWRARAAGGEAQGQVQQQQQDAEVVDSNVLPYCSIDRKQKKTIGEMEQEFLQALQARPRPLPAPTRAFFN